jgi:uncharacterized protein YkwD
MAAVAVGIAMAAGAAPATSLFTGTAHASLTSPTFSRFDTKLLEKINHARQNHGLQPLAVAAGTSDVAHSWSCHMASVRVLSHNLSLGHDLTNHGSQNWTEYDENVGYVADSAGPKRLFHAYMNSPEHRANILDPAAKFVGTWTKHGGHRLYNTIDFVGSHVTSYSYSYGGMQTSC